MFVTDKSDLLWKDERISSPEAEDKSPTVIRGLESTYEVSSWKEITARLSGRQGENLGGMGKLSVRMSGTEAGELP